MRPKKQQQQRAAYLSRLEHELALAFKHVRSPSALVSAPVELPRSSTGACRCKQTNTENKSYRYRERCLAHECALPVPLTVLPLPFVPPLGSLLHTFAVLMIILPLSLVAFLLEGVHERAATLADVVLRYGQFCFAFQ
jgi:hypothetical protein